MTKKLLPAIFIAAALLAIPLSCEKAPVPQPKPEEKPYVPAPLKEGRVALAYVTYWGTLIPDARIITHINYAFALSLDDKFERCEEHVACHSRFASR